MAGPGFGNKGMLAATYLGTGEIEAVKTPAPVPDAGEALIRVLACGVCGSDLAIVAGKHPRARAPLVIGHEISGEIVQLPEQTSTRFAVGERVTVFPLITCGQCYACRHGFSHVCRTLRVYGFDRRGGMAEYMAVPVDRLLRLPQGTGVLEGTLVEPLAVSVHAVGRTTVTADQTVVILGAGPIGLLLALVLRSRGFDRLTITDVDPFRLQVAESIGFRALNSNLEDVAAHVEETTRGEGADCVFEAAGVPATARQMTDLLRPRGTAVNVGVFKSLPAVDLRALNFKEITLMGARVYSREDFGQAIDLSKSLPLRKIVSHRFDLAEVSNAFRLLYKQEQVCKVIVQPETGR